MEEPEVVLLLPNTSPEFEFWRVRNTCPRPDLHSADQLFSNGILVPLHPFNKPHDDHPHLPDPGPDISASGEFTSSSKRWKLDIFSKNDKKKSSPEKKREKKCGAGISTAAAELNINIWPFSRSRSAGNGGGSRQRAVATQKVNSAPCSRSNSAGESRKCPGSPSRSGVHLGRSSPVWQVRRSSEGHRKVASAAGATGAKGRVLKLNVPMCIGNYRQNSVCRSDAAAAEGGGRSGGAVSGEGTRGSNLLKIRSIFTRKVH